MHRRYLINSTDKPGSMVVKKRTSSSRIIHLLHVIQTYQQPHTPCRSTSSTSRPQNVFLFRLPCCLFRLPCFRRWRRRSRAPTWAHTSPASRSWPGRTPRHQCCRSDRWSQPGRQTYRVRWVHIDSHLWIRIIRLAAKQLIAWLLLCWKILQN